MTLHKELFSCPRQRELKEKINLLNKRFIAQEQTRKQALTSNWVIKKGQTGYSRSKRHREQQRASEDQSSIMEFDKVWQSNQDADIYDSEADDKAEELEHAIDKEKRSQVK